MFNEHCVSVVVYTFTESWGIYGSSIMLLLLLLLFILANTYQSAIHCFVDSTDVGVQHRHSGAVCEKRQMGGWATGNGKYAWGAADGCCSCSSHLHAAHMLTQPKRVVVIAAVADTQMLTGSHAYMTNIGGGHH